MLSFVLMLRVLVGITASIAFLAVVNGLKACDAVKQMYPPNEATDTTCTLLAMFNATSLLIRLAFVYDSHNKMVYFLTWFTYVNVMLSYMAEFFSFQSSMPKPHVHMFFAFVAVSMTTLFTIGYQIIPLKDTPQAEDDGVFKDQKSQ